MEIVLEFALFIITGLIVFGSLAILGIIISVRVNGESRIQPPKKSPRKRLDFYVIDDLSDCDCKDVNKCDTWCKSKQRFYENPPTD